MATHVCRGHQLTSDAREHVDSKGQDEPRLLLEEGLLLSSMFSDLRCKGCPQRWLAQIVNTLEIGTGPHFNH